MPTTITVSNIISGSTVSFVFTLEKSVTEDLSIDLGLAISKVNEEQLVILYSSYQNFFIDISSASKIVKLTIEKFPISKGYYKLVGRILNNGDETDSLQNGIGEINVIEGDFYKTGNFGSMGLGSFLLKGSWEY